MRVPPLEDLLEGRAQGRRVQGCRLCDYDNVDEIFRPGTRLPSGPVRTCVGMDLLRDMDFLGNYGDLNRR